MPDVSTVFAMIYEGAHVLGLDKDSPEVQSARQIAIDAVNEGHSAEDAYRFARVALCPTAGATAA